MAVILLHSSVISVSLYFFKFQIMSYLILVRRFSVTTRFRTSVSNSPESYWQKFRRTLKENPLPIWAGLLVIGALQFRRILRRQQQGGQLESPSGELPIRPSLAIYEALPLGAVSRVFGILSQVELPLWARRTCLSWYVRTYGCDLSEACQEDVMAYGSMAQLFCRTLKDGSRVIDQQAPLTSPCDGRVLACGTIDAYGYLEQIKGISYPLRDFIGPYLPSNPQEVSGSQDTKKLYHITIYLAPGDCHHFHSPTSLTLTTRRHYPGKLMSVGLWAARNVPRLFVQNERAVYIGKWADGFFSMTAVGATNVGSISVEFDSDLKTNTKAKFFCDEKTFSDPVTLAKGQHFGQFNLGSTIVLVFEASKDFEFNFGPGQKVLMGQALGKIFKSN